MSTRPILKTHLDAVIYFIKKMDADMVSTLLHDQFEYQDFNKSLFIRKLGDLFFEFSERGDFLLLTERGECFGCTNGAKGFTFIGNKSRSYIDLVFITNKENQVVDIYECSEFFNPKLGLKKKNRLFLDKFVEFEIADEGDPFDEGGHFYDDDDSPF